MLPNSQGTFWSQNGFQAPQTPLKGIWGPGKKEEPKSDEPCRFPPNPSFFEKFENLRDILTKFMHEDSRHDKIEDFAPLIGQRTNPDYSACSSSVFLGVSTLIPEQIIANIREAKNAGATNILMGISSYLPYAYVAVQNRLFIWDILLNFQGKFRGEEGLCQAYTVEDFEETIFGIAIGAVPKKLVHEWNCKDMLVVSFMTSIRVFFLERLSVTGDDEGNGQRPPVRLSPTGFKLPTLMKAEKIFIDESGRVFVNVASEIHLKEIKLITRKGNDILDMVVNLVMNKETMRQESLKKIKVKEKTNVIKEAPKDFMKGVVNLTRKVFQLKKTQKETKAAINEISEMAFQFNLVVKDHMFNRKMKLFVRVYKTSNETFEYIGKIKSKQLIEKLRTFNREISYQLSRNDMLIQNIFPVTRHQSEDANLMVVLRNNSQALLKVSILDESKAQQLSWGLEERKIFNFSSRVKPKKPTLIWLDVISFRFGPSPLSPHSFNGSGGKVGEEGKVSSLVASVPERSLSHSFLVNSMCYLYVEKTANTQFMTATTPNDNFFTQARQVVELNSVHPLTFYEAFEGDFEIHGLTDLSNAFELPNQRSGLLTKSLRKRGMNDTSSQHLRSIFESARVISVFHSMGLDYFIHVRPVDYMYLYFSIMAEMDSYRINLNDFLEIEEFVIAHGPREAIIMALQIIIEPSMVVVYKADIEEILTEKYLKKNSRIRYHKREDPSKLYFNNFVVVQTQDRNDERILAEKLFMQLGRKCFEEQEIQRDPLYSGYKPSNQNYGANFQYQGGIMEEKRQALNEWNMTFKFKFPMTVAGESMALYACRLLSLVWNLKVGDQCKNSAEMLEDISAQEMLTVIFDKLSNFLKFVNANYSSVGPKSTGDEKIVAGGLRGAGLFADLDVRLSDGRGHYESSSPFMLQQQSHGVVEGQGYPLWITPHKYKPHLLSYNRKQDELRLIEAMQDILPVFQQLCYAMKFAIEKKDVQAKIDLEFQKVLTETPFNSYLLPKNSSILGFVLTMHAVILESKTDLDDISKYVETFPHFFCSAEDIYASHLKELLILRRTKTQEISHVSPFDSKLALQRPRVLEAINKFKSTGVYIESNLLFKLLEPYTELGAIREYEKLLLDRLKFLHEEVKEDKKEVPFAIYSKKNEKKRKLDAIELEYNTSERRSISFFLFSILRELHRLISQHTGSSIFPSMSGKLDSLAPNQKIKRVIKKIWNPKPSSDYQSELNNINVFNLDSVTPDFSKWVVIEQGSIGLWDKLIRDLVEEAYASPDPFFKRLMMTWVLEEANLDLVRLISADDVELYLEDQNWLGFPSDVIGFLLKKLEKAKNWGKSLFMAMEIVLNDASDNFPFLDPRIMEGVYPFSTPEEKVIPISFKVNVAKKAIVFQEQYLEEIETKVRDSVLSRQRADQIKAEGLQNLKNLENKVKYGEVQLEAYNALQNPKRFYQYDGNQYYNTKSLLGRRLWDLPTLEAVIFSEAYLFEAQIFMILTIPERNDSTEAPKEFVLALRGLVKVYSELLTSEWPNNIKSFLIRVFELPAAKNNFPLFQTIMEIELANLRNEKFQRILHEISERTPQIIDQLRQSHLKNEVSFMNISNSMLLEKEALRNSEEETSRDREEPFWVPYFFRKLDPSITFDSLLSLYDKLWDYMDHPRDSDPYPWYDDNMRVVRGKIRQFENEVERAFWKNRVANEIYIIVSSWCLEMEPILNEFRQDSIDFKEATQNMSTRDTLNEGISKTRGFKEVAGLPVPEKIEIWKKSAPKINSLLQKINDLLEDGRNYLPSSLFLTTKRFNKQAKHSLARLLKFPDES